MSGRVLVFGVWVVPLNRQGSVSLSRLALPERSLAEQKSWVWVPRRQFHQFRALFSYCPAKPQGCHPWGTEEWKNRTLSVCMRVRNTETSCFIALSRDGGEGCCYHVPDRDPRDARAALPVGFSVRASSAAATGGGARAASILEVDSHQRGSDDPRLPSSSRDWVFSRHLPVKRTHLVASALWETLHLGHHNSVSVPCRDFLSQRYPRSARKLILLMNIYYYSPKSQGLVLGLYAINSASAVSPVDD